jgi:hypothetical protein
MGSNHADQTTRVARRRVFYIPGYDPFHPRRYRELYRTQSAEQARISGYRVQLTPKRGGGPYGWHVTAQQDGAATETDFDVLVWSDIVRASMNQSIPATYWQLLHTCWVYIGSGALWGLIRLRKGPTIAALYPIVLLLAQAGLGLVLAIAGVTLLRALLPSGIVLGLTASVAGIALFVMTLRWFRAHDRRFYAYYLMHDYAFSAQTRGATPPALEHRMAAFTDQIAAALQTEGTDEVLIVGHSSGAHLAISVLADLIRSGRVPKDGPALGFLSLGQVVPMVSFLPRATRLRADLRYLSARDELTWVDVTAPGDGCAFALCDPVAVSGVAPPDKRWPLVISAAFSQTLSPQRWAQLRWRFFRLHFQYMCAFDHPEDYDYFRITAGPLTLARRFLGRPPSKSRIERAANRHVLTR